MDFLQANIPEMHPTTSFMLSLQMHYRIRQNLDNNVVICCVISNKSSPKYGFIVFGSVLCSSCVVNSSKAEYLLKIWAA